MCGCEEAIRAWSWSAFTHVHSHYAAKNRIHAATHTPSSSQRAPSNRLKCSHATANNIHRLPASDYLARTTTFLDNRTNSRTRWQSMFDFRKSCKTLNRKGGCRASWNYWLRVRTFSRCADYRRPKTTDKRLTVANSKKPRISYHVLPSQKALYIYRSGPAILKDEGECRRLSSRLLVTRVNTQAHFLWPRAKDNDGNKVRCHNTIKGKINHPVRVKAMPNNGSPASRDSCKVSARLLTILLWNSKTRCGLCFAG